MNFLRDTDAVYSVYLVFGIVGLITLFCNYYTESTRFKDKQQNFVFLLLAVLFSISVTFFNYRIIYILRDRFRGLALSSIINLFIIVEFIIAALGSAVVMQNWLLYLLNNFSISQLKKHRDTRKKTVPILTFLCIILVYSTVLFLFGYSGTLTLDSINQLNQIATGAYSNHHPFYHTLFL